MKRWSDTATTVPIQSADQPPAYAEDGVDLTLLRWMVSLTPTERLAVLQRNVAAVWRLRSGHRRR